LTFTISVLNYTGFVWKWSWYWKKELLSFSGSIPSKIFGIQVLATKGIEFVTVVNCHIPNSEICPKHVWLQYNIKSPRLFGLICAQTPSVVWYFIMNLISPKFHSYFALFESKSIVIFIFVHCLIISFKLCKFTQTLCGVFPSPNLNFYVVFY